MLSGPVRRGCLLLLALSLVGCASGKNDPVEPPAELESIRPVLTVRKAWDIRIGFGSENMNFALRPVVEGGRVYAAGHSGRVYSIDLETGRRQWWTNTRSPLSAGPAVGHGLVVVGASNGLLTALEVADGEQRWQVQLSGEVLAKVAITASHVFVRTVDGRLTALSALDGRELWMVEHRPPRLSLRGTAGPVVAGNVVISGFDNGRIGAYSIRDGETVWENLIAAGRGRTEIERMTDVDATPVIVGQDIYAVSYRGRLGSLALDSGQFLWTTEMSSNRNLGVDWTSVYVTDADSEVVAVNRASGAELWRQDALRMRRLTAPTPFGQSVVVGDFDGWLHWLDVFSGNIQARFRTGWAAHIEAPVSGGELLIVQDEDDRVFALRVQQRD